MSFMFTTMLDSIPKNRSEIVNELEVPEITLPPCSWREPEPQLLERSDSFVTDSAADDRGTLSTDSDIPLSRAMTDSDIDYTWYKRLRRRRCSNAKEELKAALDEFPTYYRDSLSKYDLACLTASEKAEVLAERSRRRGYLDEDLQRLTRKLKKCYDECSPFLSDDAELQDLENAVSKLKIKALDDDWVDYSL